MEDQRDNLYDLLSGFYTLLWAQLDRLIDEDRWVKVPLDEPATPRTPARILGELSILKRKGITLPMSMEQFKGEADRTQKLADNWKQLRGQLKRTPTNKELLNRRDNLKGNIQDMRALFEERALAFASLIMETP